MSEPKHTPGEWHVHEGKDHSVSSSYDFNVDLEIWATEHFDDNSNDRNEVATNITVVEDASLIAASPDLLEACKAIAKLADGQGMRNLTMAVRNLMTVASQASQAIAKAERTG